MACAARSRRLAAAAVGMAHPRRRYAAAARPHFNVVNGGAHAPNPLDFQEFMIAPLGAGSFPEAVRAGAEVYAALRGLLAGKGTSPDWVTREGSPRAVQARRRCWRCSITAITEPGNRRTGGRRHRAGPGGQRIPGEDGLYHVAGENLTSGEMIERYAQIADRFPVWLIEDGLAEDDWDGWQELTGRLGQRLQLVGDDIFVTNPAIIADAVSRGVGNAALIKVNQIGTVTETLEAIAVCRGGGYAQLVSHRSGETTDTFIADLAVSTGCGELKIWCPSARRAGGQVRPADSRSPRPGPDCRYGLPPR